MCHKRGKCEAILLNFDTADSTPILPRMKLMSDYEFDILTSTGNWGVCQTYISLKETLSVLPGQCALHVHLIRVYESQVFRRSTYPNTLFGTPRY